jgi:hypothetical protein
MPTINFVTNNADTLKYFKPVLARSVMPEWWKTAKVEMGIASDFVQTIRACPAMDDWTKSGYYILANRDIQISNGDERIKNTQNRNWGTVNDDGNYASPSHPAEQMLNLFETVEHEGIKDAFKFRNPWNIQTPPGYSVLFLDPFLFTGRAFCVWQGIIDTDRFKNNQDNAQIILYPKVKESFVIKKGTPILQILPFKREQWNASYQWQDAKTAHENRTATSQLSNEEFDSMDTWARRGYDEKELDPLEMGPYRREGYWVNKNRNFKESKEGDGPPPECPFHNKEEE